MALHGRGNLRFCGSTSWHALPHMAALLRLPLQIAWETRHQHREVWKTYCDEFRQFEPLRLVRMALLHGNIVSGIRDLVEIEAAVKEEIFDSILWVHRPGFPIDPTLSYDPAKFATDKIVNDETLHVLHCRVDRWASAKGYYRL